jgi:hypothetical protein
VSLKPRHRPVVRAFAEAMFQHDEPLDERRLDGFAEELDRFISPASKTLRFGLLLLIDVLRWLPLVVVGRVSLFEDLKLQDRVTMLERLEHSRIAPMTLLLVALKTVSTLLFFEDDAETRALGYPGPARERWKRRLGMAPEQTREAR